MSRQALQCDEAGIPTGILEINVDVTAERRLEDQLRQAHKLEAIGTLAGGIAHDFNNILAAIMGNVELALDDTDEGSPVQRNLEEIMKASHRARDRVKEILTFGRKSVKEHKPLHLIPLLEETFNFLRASLPSTIDMDLRTTVISDMVIADWFQLQQVLMDLATNAAQAMPDGGTLEIALADARFDQTHPAPDPELKPGEYIELSVRDTGEGMDEAVRRRIFEPFFTTKETGRGSGLGLAVVYGIVKGCGGAITVESQSGKGSIFRVFLPKANPDVNTLGKAGVLSHGAVRVLFVDDEEPLRSIVQSTLSRIGYDVATEGDPVVALSRFSEDPEGFDIIVTDFTMPHMTGLAFSREVLQIRPGMPILLCTGYNDTVDEECARAAGIRAFLTKPIARQDLVQAISRVLRETV